MHKNLTKGFDEDGFFIVPKLLSHDKINKLTSLCESIIHKEEAFYAKAGVASPYGRVFSCIHYDDFFLSIFLDDNFYHYFKASFDEPHPIIHVYTTSSIPPKGKNVFSKMHNDSALQSKSFIEGIGCIIMLSPFTEKNGATCVLPGSHKEAAPPDLTTFEENSIRILGNPGDVLFFNPNLWHSSCPNKTQEWRHSLSIGISRPWIRPHVDHLRLLKDRSLIQSHPRLKQLVGYYSQPYHSEMDYYERS